MNQKHLQRIYASEEDRQLARILTTLIWATWGVYLVVILTSLFYNHDWKLIAVTLAGSALLIMSMVLLRRGRLRTSSMLVVLGTLGTVTVVATVGQGIRDLALIAFPIIFVFAGLTLNRALFRLCVSLAFVAVCWLVLGENYGWFVPVPFVGEMANWLYLISTIIILLVAALAVELLATNLRKSLELARQEIAQRKHAEEREAASLSEVKNSEKRFHALIEHGRDNISLLAADGSLLWESPTVNNILGYAPNQFVGHNIFELMHPTDQAWTSDLYAQIVQSPGSIQNGEFRLLHADGTWRWIECSATNLLDEPGVQAIVLNYRDITARKHAEEKLRESEEKFRTAFMVSPDSININRLDDGMYVSINQGFTQVMGYSETDVIGKTSLDIHIWDNPADRQRLAAGLKKDGFVSNLEARFLRKDGGVMYGLMSAAVINLGDIPHIFSITRDITERKRLEEAIKQSEAKYRKMVETTNEGVIVLDHETRMTLVNQQMAAMLGYTTEELLERKLESLFFEEDLGDHRSQMASRAQGQSAVYERCFRRKDGGRLWTLISATATNDAEGHFDGAFGMITDITERKRAEEKFTKAFWASPTIVTITRLSNGCLVDVNESFEKIIGYTRAEALEHTVFELGIWVNLAEREHLVPLLLANGRLRNEEVHFQTKRGETIACLYSAELIELNGEKCALAVIEDITTRKQAEAKIRTALEEKETLLREVHHRVKNNLQVIISLIKMRARSTHEAGMLQFLTELEGQAHTMSLVYEQLYQSENLARVSMAQYLRQLTANVLDTYGRRDAIQFHLDAPLALDVAQATPCGLIVNELFSNILKYAFPPGFKEKPVVSITLRQDDETYHLTISDNGVGFPSGYDWRAGQSMGLRLVNLWVTHQLGGTLAVSGKPGTTFAIAFDVKD